jgi:hypothetical protein
MVDVEVWGGRGEGVWGSRCREVWGVTIVERCLKVWDVARFEMSR